MNTESPTIIASAYGASSTVNMLSGESGQLLSPLLVTNSTGGCWDVEAKSTPLDTVRERMERSRRIQQKNVFIGYDEIDQTTPEPPTTTENMSNKKEKRLVQVYVVDPHPDVPLDKSVLYSQPSPILTDATDQELFFQIDMKQILHDHNQVRVKTVDKEASKSFNKEVFLEPVRIRDLVMNILTIARF